MKVNCTTRVGLKTIKNSELRIQLRRLNFEKINIPIYLKGSEICESNIVGYVTEIYIDCSDNLSDVCLVNELNTIQSKAIFTNYKLLSELELVPIYLFAGDELYDILRFELQER